MPSITSNGRHMRWWLGIFLTLLASIGSYLAVRFLPPSSPVSQVGLGVLFQGALVGFVQLFTVTIPWFVEANRSPDSSAANRRHP